MQGDQKNNKHQVLSGVFSKVSQRIQRGSSDVVKGLRAIQKGDQKEPIIDETRSTVSQQDTDEETKNEFNWERDGMTGENESNSEEKPESSFFSKFKKDKLPSSRNINQGGIKEKFTSGIVAGLIKTDKVDKMLDTTNDTVNAFSQSVNVIRNVIVGQSLSDKVSQNIFSFIEAVSANTSGEELTRLVNTTQERQLVLFEEFYAQHQKLYSVSNNDDIDQPSNEDAKSGNNQVTEDQGVLDAQLEKMDGNVGIGSAFLNKDESDTDTTASINVSISDNIANQKMHKDIIVVIQRALTDAIFDFYVSWLEEIQNSKNTANDLEEHKQTFLAKVQELCKRIEVFNPIKAEGIAQSFARQVTTITDQTQSVVKEVLDVTQSLNKGVQPMTSAIENVSKVTEVVIQQVEPLLKKMDGVADDLGKISRNINTLSTDLQYVVFGQKNPAINYVKRLIAVTLRMLEIIQDNIASDTKPLECQDAYEHYALYFDQVHRICEHLFKNSRRPSNEIEELFGRIKKLSAGDKIQDISHENCNKILQYFHLLYKCIDQNLSSENVMEGLSIIDNLAQYQMLTEKYVPDSCFLNEDDVTAGKCLVMLLTICTGNLSDRNDKISRDDIYKIVNLVPNSDHIRTIVLHKLTCHSSVQVDMNTILSTISYLEEQISSFTDVENKSLMENIYEISSNVEDITSNAKNIVKDQSYLVNMISPSLIPTQYIPTIQHLTRITEWELKQDLEKYTYDIFRMSKYLSTVFNEPIYKLPKDKNFFMQELINSLIENPKDMQYNYSKRTLLALFNISLISMNKILLEYQLSNGKQLLQYERFNALARIANKSLQPLLEKQEVNVVKTLEYIYKQWFNITFLREHALKFIAMTAMILAVSLLTSSVIFSISMVVCATLVLLCQVAMTYAQGDPLLKYQRKQNKWQMFLSNWVFTLLQSAAIMTLVTDIVLSSFAMTPILIPVTISLVLVSFIWLLAKDMVMKVIFPEMYYDGRNTLYDLSKSIPFRYNDSSQEISDINFCIQDLYDVFVAQDQIEYDKLMRLSALHDIVGIKKSEDKEKSDTQQKHEDIQKMDDQRLVGEGKERISFVVEEIETVQEPSSSAVLVDDSKNPKNTMTLVTAKNNQGQAINGTNTK
ncbi:MAG: hypothetical protein P857_718 [Candidatus Xenolissoclinum pacificiensis L6]|uniref:Transmembrane protein n=1 Tax=Candidatus Xenolissoclinum pacificiensis L6 TaxID=1401685 RepID=W2V0R8_9RICK|nr:MAG: hypothetical protein P857_718 [Candidatus Xenolissoclinum pacificiensis L6]